MAGRPRTPPEEGSLPAQGALLSQFEALYFDRLSKTQADMEAEFRKSRRGHRWFRKRSEAKEEFSKSTYASWKRQESSPRIADLEILAALCGARLRVGLGSMSDPVATVSPSKNEGALPVLSSQAHLVGAMVDQFFKDPAARDKLVEVLSDEISRIRREGFPDAGAEIGTDPRGSR